MDISEIRRILKDPIESVDLMLKYSKDKKELEDVVINYHPQDIDNYYKDALQTKITIAEFILDDNLKRKIKEDLKSKEIESKEKEKEIEEIIDNIIKNLPSKAFVIRTNNIGMVLDQYDRVKEELKNLENNNLVFNPQSVMYNALATIYNVEKNISKVYSNDKEKFIKPVKVDLLPYGVFAGNLAGDFGGAFRREIGYDNSSDEIILGSVFNVNEGKLYSASNDTDIVIHQLGHKILDNLRPFYYEPNDNYFETQAIHEAFGDINAFLYAASDPNIEKYIKDNNIDLSKANLISVIGEYFSVKVTSSKIPVRDLSKDFKYKHNIFEFNSHLYSKSLSNAVYKAFVSFYINNNEKYGLNEVANKFYNVLIKGTRISNPATTTIPEFMKSIIIADILFNNSELSEYLLRFANENKILKKSNLESILREIKKSREVNIEPIKEVLKGKEIKELEKVIKEDKEFEKEIKEACLNILKKHSDDFDYLTADMLFVYLVPGFNNGLNIEVVYRGFNDYGGGAIFVLDNEMNLIYSYIEKP